MTNLEVFQAFVAPAIFISAAGLLVLSLNTRLMGIVARMRNFHRERHNAAVAGNKQEVIAFQSQIESLEQRARKIKNAFFYTLLGILGTMVTCLLLGLTVQFPDTLVIAVVCFVLSVLSMAIGMVYYIAEVSVALTSVKEEAKLYDVIDRVDLSREDAVL